MVTLVEKNKPTSDGKFLMVIILLEMYGQTEHEQQKENVFSFIFDPTDNTRVAKMGADENKIITCRIWAQNLSQCLKGRTQKRLAKRSYPKYQQAIVPTTSIFLIFFLTSQYGTGYLKLLKPLILASTLFHHRNMYG